MDFTSMRMNFLDRKIKDVISYCWGCEEEEEVMAFESLVKCASKPWSNFCGHQQAPKNLRHLSKNSLKGNPKINTLSMVGPWLLSSKPRELHAKTLQ
jgi:hypothetical protein